LADHGRLHVTTDSLCVDADRAVADCRDVALVIDAACVDLMAANPYASGGEVARIVISLFKWPNKFPE
jgi:hypothetical protein